MTKIKYEIESLTRAIELLSRYEDEESYVPINHTDLDLVHIINYLFAKMKTHLSFVSCSMEKKRIIELFQVITEISFDNLEKNVMGVN